MSETNNTGKKPTLSIGSGGGSNNNAVPRRSTSSNSNKKAHSGTSALLDGLVKPFNNNLTHKQILHILNGPAFADDQFAHLLPILCRFCPSFKIPQLDWLAGLNEEGQELVRSFCIKDHQLAHADLPAGEIEFHAIQKE
ncbi:hypothetical protein NLI96_g12230 [Meripilus lineatus]|uniref:Uncharacterized protein n=1 Tax=Meripilus lineatus TaxID=2056292 RepID=A0AAD5YA26_9APHY|nr:hypothetical protein NLI96_g12230 [Physisporinus lineatus]